MAHQRTRLPRRELLLWSAATGAMAAVGCAGVDARPTTPRMAAPASPAAPDTGPAPPAATLGPAERAKLAAGEGALAIVQREEGGRGVLRRRAQPLTSSDLIELARLDQRMRATLHETGSGVGLAAPQVGIGARAALVMLDARGESSHVELFVNPRIVERSDEIEIDYEGCLSIPGICGLVRRNRNLVVEHGSPGEPRRRLEVAHFDARIFQHELDHLDGVLYIDRVEGGLQPIERLPELREQLRREQPVAALPHAWQRRAVLL